MCARFYIETNMPKVIFLLENFNSRFIEIDVVCSFKVHNSVVLVYSELQLMKSEYATPKFGPCFCVIS